MISFQNNSVRTKCTKYLHWNQSNYSFETWSSAQIYKRVVVWMFLALFSHGSMYANKQIIWIFLWLLLLWPLLVTAIGSFYVANHYKQESECRWQANDNDKYDKTFEYFTFIWCIAMMRDCACEWHKCCRKEYAHDFISSIICRWLAVFVDERANKTSETDIWECCRTFKRGSSEAKIVRHSSYFCVCVPKLIIIIFCFSMCSLLALWQWHHQWERKRKNGIDVWNIIINR